MKVWDAQTGKEALSLKGHTSRVASVAWSPDGKRILTGGGGDDLPQKPLPGEVKVWEADKGQEIFALKGHTECVTSVAFSPDGKRAFAWDAQNKVLAWSSETGQPVDPADPPAQPQAGPSRSPDGFLTATPQGNAGAVTDARLPCNDDAWPLPDAAERKRYHTEQAALAEKEQQWFAVAFHVGRLLLDDPDNTDLKKRREEALRKHAAP